MCKTLDLILKLWKLLKQLPQLPDTVLARGGDPDEVEVVIDP